MTISMPKLGVKEIRAKCIKCNQLITNDNNVVSSTDVDKEVLLQLGSIVCKNC